MSLRRKRDDSGAAAVEAALLIPFLLLPLLFGAFEVGRLWWIKTELANAAREGSTYAQFFPNNVDCSAPNSIEDKARLAYPYPDDVSVAVVQANDPTTPTSWTSVTGCGTAGVNTDARVRVIASQEVQLLLNWVIPVSDFTVDLDGYQDVRVLG